MIIGLMFGVFVGNFLVYRLLVRLPWKVCVGIGALAAVLAGIFSWLIHLTLDLLKVLGILTI